MNNSSIHRPPIVVKPSPLIDNNINRREALVVNNVSEHVVQFDGLTCSCKQCYCAAIFAAIRERVAMKHGGLDVMFTGNHMLTYLMARVLRRDGLAVSIHIEHGWYWLVYGDRAVFAEIERAARAAVDELL